MPTKILIGDLMKPIFDFEHLLTRFDCLAAREVQLAAQLVLHHGYAVRMVIGEKKSDDRGGVYKEPPEDHYKAALMSFYKAARKQLRVEDPEDITAQE